MNKTFYRFWDKESQLMSESMSLADMINGKQIDYVNGDMTEFTDFNFEKHLVPMLRSGTTDNNGKRLFDQDVVKLNGGTYIVQFTGSVFRIADVKSDIEFFEDKEDFDYGTYHDEPLDMRPMTLVGDWFTLKEAITAEEINLYKKS